MTDATRDAEMKALLAENASLREEIASLRLAVSRVIPTFEGRDAPTWASYARDAERRKDKIENLLREVYMKLEGVL